MMNENKCIFMLKYPAYLTTKYIESKYFGNHWKVCLHSGSSNQQLTEVFNINRAAEHKACALWIFWPNCSVRILKGRDLVQTHCASPTSPKWINAIDLGGFVKEGGI